MSRRDYPQLYKAYERLSDHDTQLAEAIKTLKKAALSKGHYEAEIVDAEAVFLKAVSLAWTKGIVDRFFLTVDSQPKPVVSYVQRLKLDTPASILQSYSQAIETDLQGRAVTAIYEFLDELAPLADQVNRARSAAIVGVPPAKAG